MPHPVLGLCVKPSVPVRRGSVSFRILSSNTIFAARSSLPRLDSVVDRSLACITGPATREMSKQKRVTRQLVGNAPVVRAIAKLAEDREGED